jgi:MoaA/NifB/PqqE/SkfB family radical SAM enzyme
MTVERRVFVDSPPVRITIETTTLCNQDCVMCVHSLKDDHHARPQHLS